MNPDPKAAQKLDNAYLLEKEEISKGGAVKWRKCKALYALKQNYALKMHNLISLVSRESVHKQAQSEKICENMKNRSYINYVDETLSLLQAIAVYRE